MTPETAALPRRRFFAPLRQGIAPGSRWVEYVARTGYLAKGIVYGLVGLLAVQAALTAARSPGTSDALDAIRSAPFGRLLMALVAAGLLCYVAWRFIQAWFDTERKGRDWKGIPIRAGYAISGGAYFLLAVAAASAALRGGSPAAGNGDQQAAAALLAWPGGWLVLVVVGVVVVGVGVAHFRRAYLADFMHEYEYAEMSDPERDWAKPVGRLGLSARGVTFCLIGLFLISAAWKANAGEVKSLPAAFNTLAAQPYGQFLFAVVALGFVAYGVYCLSRAKYRRIAQI